MMSADDTTIIAETHAVAQTLEGTILGLLGKPFMRRMA